ncbi:MAG: hypothetical protein AAFZ80_02640 [Cyanobacteria bacterium P01_A01_bin.105]
MSSSASRPPEFSESADSSAAKSGLRPSLVGPPKRPVKPPKPPTVASPPTAAPPPPAATPTASPPPVAPPAAAMAEPAEDVAEPEVVRQQPISPPSEPMQYRAIGLLRGRYVPTEEAFNRGQIIGQDQTPIDAVLLGRVTSLVKKYLDMESNHLWVVYPRTNPEADNALNVQIVGVWEPETLMGNNAADSSDANTENGDATAEGTVVEASDGEASAKDAEATVAEATVAEPEAAKAAVAEPVDAAPVDAESLGAAIEAASSGSVEADAVEADAVEADAVEAAPVDYVPADEIEADIFSIRGEVARYHDEKGEILIGIQQKVKSGNRQQRTFKLMINGKISEKTIGYFWDFEVRREGLALVVHGGSCIAAVPPKKHKKRMGGGVKKRFTKGGPRKSYDSRDRQGEGENHKPYPRRDRHDSGDTPKPRPVIDAAPAAPVETSTSVPETPPSE